MKDDFKLQSQRKDDFRKQALEQHKMFQEIAVQQREEKNKLLKEILEELKKRP